jgi:3'-phosphoadenosine 5'-phosphosulfate sulfotransferase (PAPS reductase)/FAD synthetase
MNQYTLPEGFVQISFSGGRTSAYMLHEILEANGGLPDRARVVFANTGREMPETLDFVQEVSDRWSVPIVWVEYETNAAANERFRIVSHNSAARNGEPFADIIYRKRFLPNQNARWCTAELKVRPARDYLRSLGWEHWISALGIRADEPDRVNREPQKERWQRWYPLADANVSKHDVALFWRKQPFDLRLANIKGKTPLGNCDGCFLKSEKSQAALAREYPERHAWWEQMELWVSQFTLGDGAKFRKEFSKRELRSFVEAQGDWIFDDTNGALCQADQGECVE